MAVWCSQLYNDVKSGDDYLIAPVADGDSDRDLLNRKAASHEARGWTVTWNGPTSFTATILTFHGEISKKRIFEIR